LSEISCLLIAASFKKLVALLVASSEISCPVLLLLEISFVLFAASEISSFCRFF
jgi:hypothetical protein